MWVVVGCALAGGFAGIRVASRQPDGWALIAPLGTIGTVIGVGVGVLLKVFVL